MKKFVTLLAIYALFCCSIRAQVPYFKNVTPTRASANFSSGMPFGLNATAGARLQAFYPPGIFGSSVPSGGINMNRIYFWADSTWADTIQYSNMTITLGEFSSAPSLGFAWMTGAAKQTTVVSGSVQIYARDSNWFYIDFGSLYSYDPGKYLMVDIIAGSQSPFLGVWNVKSGPSNGPYLSATSAAAATPNTLGGGANLPAIGMDPFLGFNNAAMERPILATTCSPSQDVVVKVKNMGRNVINQVTVNWMLNSTLQTPITLTNPIDTFGSGNNDTTFSLGTISVATGPADVVAWVSAPNLSTDPDRSNDTAYFKVGSPLNGSYLISNLGSTSFTTIGSAVQALYDFGVCGPVTFLVDTATFYEQVTIAGLINGSSPTNSITFNGVDRDKSLIAFGAGIVNAKHVIKLQATAYIQFRNLTVKTLSSTYGWGFHLLDTCKSIGIKGCKLDNSTLANSSTANNSAGISVSGLPTGLCIPGPCATALTTAARADSLEIDSNLFLFGYEAINITGNSTTLLGRANKIRGNTILYAYQYSINLVSQSHVSVLNNYIVPRPTGAAANVGIFMNAVISTGISERSMVSGNKIFSYGTAGISMTNCIGSDSTQKGWVTNNMIGGREQLLDANPIYMTGCRNWSVSHNTLSRDIPGTAAVTASCIRMLGTTTNITLMNNIFSVAKQGIAIPVHLLAANNTDSMNYNCFYRADTSTNNQLINIAGTGYSFSNFRGAAGFNNNSSFAKPVFINDTNLYLSSNCGIPTGPLLNYASIDVNGTLRPANPLAGAHQKILSNNNLAVTILRQPVSPVSPGSTPVRAVVQNLGGNAVITFTLAYRVNNGTPVTQTVTPTIPLNTCDTLQVLFSGFTLGATDTMVNLIVYSYLPNGFADSEPDNDTLRVKLFTPLGGTYTIGGPGADFANFNEAVFALQTAGIKSSVNFEVYPGTYNEQVTLKGPIAGTQNGRRITFDGMDSSDRVLTFSGNAGLPHTFRIENVPYVTVRNLKIISNGIGNGWPVHLAGGCNGTWIKACAIGISGAGSTSTSTNFMGITLSGATITTAVRADSMEIDSNYIQYGYHGINLYGGSALVGIYNRIRNNQVFGVQQYSVYLVYQQTPEVSRNSIFCRGATTGVGVYLQNVTTPATGTLFTNISNNKLANYGTAGIYLTACTNIATNKGRILNNAVGGMVKLAGSNSIYATSSTHWLICNNSINHDFGTTTATTAAAIRLVGSASATTGISLFNNSIAVTGNGQALPLYTQVATNIDAMDYNLFFRNDTTNGFCEYLGANVVYGAFRGANNFNRNSLFQRPGYTGSVDLMPNPADSFSWSLNGRGTYLSYAPKDINQTQRPATNWDGVPDIGAYEFTPTSVPPAAKALPDTSYAFGTQYFSYGMDTVASITWGSTVPGYIAVRQFSGVMPYLLDASKNYMHFYTSISSCPTSSLNINYHDNWIGTHTSETGIWLEQIDLGSGAWNIYSFSSSIDTVKNQISTTAFAVLPATSYFSGTNANPTTMPVKLLSFTGQRESGQIKLQWTTASEHNSKAFAIERSFNGKDFSQVGYVYAAGESNRIIHYHFSEPASENHPVLYYRLRMIDRDQSFALSEVLILDLETDRNENKPVVFPNPFTSSLYASWNLPLNGSNIQLRLFDLSGKCIFTQELISESGSNVIELPGSEQLLPGCYLLQLEYQGEKTVKRLVKN